MFKRPCLVAAFLPFCCLTLKGQTFANKLKDFQALVKTYGPVACQKNNPDDTEALRSIRAKAALAAMEVLKTSEQQLKSLIDARLKELRGMGLTESELARLSQFYQSQEDQLTNPCAATPSPATNQALPAAAPEQASPPGQAASASSQPAVAPAANREQKAPTGAGAVPPVSSAPVKPAPGAQAPQPPGTPNTGAPQAGAKSPKETQSTQGSQAPPATKPPIEPGPSGLYTLGMAGLDITSTTTSGPQQQYFAEFDLTAPVSLKIPWCDKSHDDPLADHCWVWFNPRIASVPTPKTTVLNSLATSNAGLSAAGNMTLGDITQTLEFRGGFEFPIFTPREGILFGNDPKSSESLSLIVGFGAVTPFDSATGAQEFDLTPSTSACANPGFSGQMCGNATNAWNQFKDSVALQNQYPQLYNALKNDCAQPASGSSSSLTNCPDLHTAFVLPDRSRFYRIYYGGLRLRTFFFKDKDSNHRCVGNELQDPNFCVPRDEFPGNLDLTFGQDETVTGGRLVGTVLTIAANYPFPHYPWLRIFGQANLRLARNLNSEPLTLPAAETFVPLTDPSVIIQNIQPRDQDYFRIGFGVDLAKALGAFRSEASKAPAAMLTPAGNVSFESDKAQEITVTNIGGSPLKIDSVTKAGANPDDFNITEPDPCKGKSLDRAKGCTLTVTFKPKDKTPGTRSATLSIKDNAPDQPQIITLTGTVSP